MWNVMGAFFGLGLTGKSEIYAWRTFIVWVARGTLTEINSWNWQVIYQLMVCFKLKIRSMLNEN